MQLGSLAHVAGLRHNCLNSKCGKCAFQEPALNTHHRFAGAILLEGWGLLDNRGRGQVFLHFLYTRPSTAETHVWGERGTPHCRMIPVNIMSLALRRLRRCMAGRGNEIKLAKGTAVLNVRSDGLTLRSTKLWNRPLEAQPLSLRWKKISWAISLAAEVA